MSFPSLGSEEMGFYLMETVVRIAYGKSKITSISLLIRKYKISSSETPTLMYNNFRFYSKSTIKEGIVVVVVRQPHVPTCLTAYRYFYWSQPRTNIPGIFTPEPASISTGLIVADSADVAKTNSNRWGRELSRSQTLPSSSPRTGRGNKVCTSFSSDEIAFRKNLQFFNSTSLRFVWFRERRERKSMRRVGEISRSRGVYLIYSDSRRVVRCLLPLLFTTLARVHHFYEGRGQAADWKPHRRSPLIVRP